MEMIFTILIFAAIGVGIYRLDMWFVKLLSKKGKNEKQKGILVGRQLPARLIAAAVVMLIKLYLITHVGNESIIVYTIIEYAAVVVGFYAAPWVIAKWPSAVKKGKQYVKDVESGKTDPLNDVKEKLNKITSPFNTGETIVEEKETVVIKPEEKVEEKEDIKDDRSGSEKMSEAVNGFLHKKTK